ncbi:YadA-like family protein, partial [Dyella sp. S184]|uniref:YadA family autotransporter adhesin n=1 Tax=Dyella sp. S184 TaxID=1641862 RepID=UPI001C209789
QNTTNIATNTASIGTINNTAVFYTDASRTAVVLGNGSTPVTLGNVADGSAIHDAVNKGQLDAAVANVSGNLADLTDSAVKYDDSDDEQITLAGANGTRISNLQASNVLSDAATVGQINDLLSAFGGGAMLQAGGGISLPSFAIQGGAYNNVGDALGALDTALAGAWSGISNIDNRVSLLEQNYASGGTTNTHVATDGPNDGTDAASVVPGSTGVAVGSHATAGGDHGTAVGGDSYAAGSNDTAIGGNAKVNADGSTAVGANTTIAASATNAVAVGEGASVTEASGTALGQGSSVTAVGAVALGQGSVADRANTVSVGTAANQRQITNVAAGTQATDVANVGQVQEALVTAKTYADAGDQQTLQKANAYTDQKIGSFATTSDINALRDQVNGQFHAVDKRMNQVGAMGTAMAQMSFSTQGVNTPNRVGVGVGGYHGEAALSVGYSRQLSSKANLTFGAAVSGNEASGGVGVGFGW